MKAELKFDCRNCIDDITINIRLDGRSLPTMQEIRDIAIQRGWRIGKDCYCPNCLRELPAHCNTCEHFEGNKSMGSSLCRLDGSFTTANDYCTEHKPFREHKQEESQ